MPFEEKLTGSLEDNLLALLVTNPHNALEVAQKVPLDLYSTRPYQRLVGAAIEHLEKHRQPIGVVHLRDWVDTHQMDMRDKDFLFKVIDEIAKIRDDLQATVVLNELDKFITHRIMTLAVRKAEDVLYATRDTDAARVFLWEAINAAPAPYDLPDPWAALVAPPFNPAILPRTLRNFVEDRTKAMGVDPAGLAWAALSACSAALDGNIRLEIEPGFEVPPGLWVLLLGESGIGKTPITRAAWRQLELLQREEADRWQAAKAEWEQQPKETRGPEPVPKRYIIKDATIESLQAILVKQDRGAAKVLDEWASFIGQFDKYSASKGAGLVDRAFYLQSWDGGPYTVDRINRGTLFIRNLHLVVFGGIQPERLRALGNLTDDGLLQRACVIVLRSMQSGSGDAAGRHVGHYEALIESLARVEGDRVIGLGRDARAVRDRVKRRVAELRGNDALGQGFRAFVDKLVGVWGRLTLVIGFVMHEDGSRLLEIGQGPAAAAEVLVEHLLEHAARFYEWMGGGGNADMTKAIAGYLLTKKRSRIVASDITTNVHACHHMSLRAVQEALSPLVAMGWLAPERDHNSNSWRVADRIYTQFAERAELERFRRKQVREIIQGKAATLKEREANPENPAGIGGSCNSASIEKDSKKYHPTAHKQDSPEMHALENKQDSPERASPRSVSQMRRKFIYRRPPDNTLEARTNQSNED